jgi:hypothetical protein
MVEMVEQPASAEFDGRAEATRSTAGLFQWSDYVHVGRGAEECEHGQDGSCSDVEHFHAWVCLPNTFQIRDITDKARAAKARKVRSLRDTDSDAHEVIEGDLYELRSDHWDELVAAIARAQVEKRLVDIVHGVVESDERFEHHDQDREELQRLLALPEDEQDKAEVERLQADMLAYSDAMQAVIDRENEAEEKRLRAMAADDVVELERRARVEEIGVEAYLHTYYTWCIYVGTREPHTEQFSSRRKFAEPAALHDAAPEIVVALREKIRDLEQRTIVRSNAAGNS